VAMPPKKDKSQQKADQKKKEKKLSDATFGIKSNQSI
jgi:hypothetical protein